MNQQIPKYRLKTARPARYQILVQGALDERWSRRLGGLAISTLSTATGSSVTRLSGEVLDQAALFGVLNTLYELHLPLISVWYQDEE